jgi:hypothetical protein
MSLRYSLPHSLVTLHLSRWTKQSYTVISGYPMPIRQIAIEWRWTR